MTTSPATTSVPAAPVLTPSQLTNVEITAYLRGKRPVLWIVTTEELRVERACQEAAAAAKFPCLFWDCASGLQEIDAKGNVRVRVGAQAGGTDPDNVLGIIRDSSERAVYILRDFHKWLASPITARGLRSRARELPSRSADRSAAIIILAPTAEIPKELEGAVTVINYPIPDRVEIGKILDSVIESLRIAQPEIHKQVTADLVNGKREAAVDAAVGLTAEEATNCYSHSLVTTRRIDPALVGVEKKRVVEREKVLTWTDPDPLGLAAVGGLDVVKQWLVERRSGFSQEAREFGLDAPKGAVVVGFPGTGKSLLAKCVASAWSVPLLRIDFGALRSKYVGESEANIRKALQVAEAVSPCVLWVDEIEKALAGSTGEQGDGGVSADALGAFLSWMQERKGSVFVIATANDVSKLPPELLRKGRFDETFFVDFPNAGERAEVLKVTLAQKKRTLDGIDVAAFVAATDGFTGAEIASTVPDALFAAFADGKRAITTADLLAAAEKVVPLSVSAQEKVKALRDWAKGRARLASRPVEAPTENAGGARALEL